MRFSPCTAVAFVVLLVAGIVFSNQLQAHCWYPGSRIVKSVRSSSCQTKRTTTVRTAVKTVTKTVELTDQQACEEECKRMIKLRRLHVFKTPLGCFEGCGISRSKDVATCRPSRKMRLTGDCTIEQDGWFYRCRLWR